MKEKLIQQILDQIGQKAFPDSTNAWASIQNRLEKEEEMKSSANPAAPQVAKQLKLTAGLISAIVIVMIFLLTVPKNQAFAETLRHFFNPSAVRTPKATPTKTGDTDGTYTVTEGDTLTGIAAAFGITIDQLLETNPQLNRTGLVVGDTLRFPEVEKCSETVSVTVQKNDTMALLASKLGVTVEEIKAANPNFDPSLLVVGDELVIEREVKCADTLRFTGVEKCSETVFVTVQVGDTLAMIANRMGVTVQEVIEANPNTDYSLHVAGEVLKIEREVDCADTPEPMPAGNFYAETGFGQMVFTVGSSVPGRTRISKIAYQFNDWSCGQISLDTYFVDAAGYSLDEQNSLELETQFYFIGIPPIKVTGTYDAKKHIFYGTWELYTAGTTCSGQWSTIVEEFGTIPPGEWIAETDFGSLYFKVGSSVPGRTRISQLFYNFTDWSCGGIELTPVGIFAGFYLDDQNKIEIQTPIDGVTSIMSILGQYDSMSQTFYGTWEVNTAQEACTGAWAATYQE